MGSDLSVFVFKSVGDLHSFISLGVPGDGVVKNPPASAGDGGDSGSTPGSGRSPGERNGYPLWYSYLQNSMDRGAWRATVLGVAKSQTRLSN